LANEVGGALHGYSRVTRGRHKPIGRIAQKGQRIFAFERPLLLKPLYQAKHHRRAREADFVCASPVEHGSPRISLHTAKQSSDKIRLHNKTQKEDAMGMMIIRHKVRDYGQWQPIFDGDVERQKAAGLSNPRVYHSADSNKIEIVVVFDAKDTKKAKDFAASPDLKEVMGNAGVMDAPTFHFL
jgi:hypothetical protein